MASDRFRSGRSVYSPHGSGAGQFCVMSTMRRFAISRLWAIVVKEFIQMRRDRVTFGMMIGVPLIQLVLFGYAINADPKRLPTAFFLPDYDPQGRLFFHALRTGGYFELKRR